MAWHVAKPSRADPEAAAELPADGPGAYEHLHAAPQHSRLLRLRAGPATAANPPADIAAVDAAGPTTAADLPAAGRTATAGLPTDGAGVDEHLHADVQYPALLRSGRVADGTEGNLRGADRGLRRDERLRGCTAVGQPLRRRIAACSRLREPEQGPRDPLRADRPKDKCRFLRSGHSNTSNGPGF